MTKTVIEYALSRLREIGIADVFGVPGDYAFPVNDAICNDPRMRWIGCTNELNAAYAADGYARIKGVGAVCTTFAVGELSAINAIAGSYAEHLPVFHLVGMPNMATQAGRKAVHHTLGNGEFDLFRRMSEPVTAATAVMMPETAARETERLIFEALYHRRPVYMGFPADLALKPVLDTAEPIPMPPSDAQALAQVSAAILEALSKAKTAVVLAGMLVGRTGQSSALSELLDASGLPFATMFMGKSVLDEQHPGYIGMYDGSLLEPEVQKFVEHADLVLDIGAPLTDFNSGVFTARLDPAKTIYIGHHHTRIGAKTFANVELGDLLAALAARLSRRDWPKRKPSQLGAAKGSGADPITADALYPRWAKLIEAGDVVIAETGTASMGLGFALLPKGASFHNQTLWGSIGWATPAAVGAATAAPGRRTVLITGEGSHQLTVQELGQFARLGLKPIVFVLNNDGYLIERLLCKDPDIAYNDLAQWHYTELPHAFGCEDWMCLRVTTCAELDDAMARARNASTGVYIEVITDKYVSSPLALKLHDAMQAIYRA
ncbi:alpha-keto acid decarboxylase family protein [Aestuariivirga sp.]|uniref:alpha-keto acid decarboxylase family protein n=1 Tax=Aestuariivirga sp. TaxID=2650926 RepID=UPI0039E448AC